MNEAITSQTIVEVPMLGIQVRTLSVMPDRERRDILRTLG
jgi:hypothetical protein